MIQNLQKSIFSRFLRKKGLYNSVPDTSCTRQAEKTIIFIGVFGLLGLLPQITNAQVAEKWVAKYNESAQQSLGRKVLADGSGNIYVAGITYINNSNDFVLIKYNQAGVEQWKAVYNGGGQDELVDLKLDANGNILVTGNSSNSTVNNYDFTTVKYNADGEQKWVAKYNGNSTTGTNNYSYDYARAMAVDAQGNVYVTGQTSKTTSDGNSYDYDYATVKYNAFGEQQWVAKYSGNTSNSSGYSYDNATAIAVDAQGNIYVTGQSMKDGVTTSSNHDYDYATIKYNSMGQQQWVARYSENTSSTNNYSYDYARAMVVDAEGNVYVTGQSMKGSTTDRYTNDYDYATVKYNTMGEQQWVSRYSGNTSSSNNSYDIATAMAIDAKGNVYVTGQSITSTDGTNNYNNYDYATVKYNQAGEQQWVSRYNGNSTSTNNYSHDQATDVAVDANGNVYVTGYSMNANTSSYDHDDIDFMFYPDYDYATVKYKQTGEQEWVAKYNGTSTNRNSYDLAYSLAVDKNGNAYVTGQSYNGASYGIATIKYSSNFPTVISSDVNTITNSSPIRVKIDFGNNVSDFTQEDIQVSGGRISKFSGADKQYLAEITPEGDGEIKVDVAEGVATNEFENVNGQAQPFAINFDNTAPAAPVITSVSNDSGVNGTDQTTADNTLKLFGIAEANALVTLNEKALGRLGTTHANADGNWAFSYEEVGLEEGVYTFSATATDVATNTGSPSQAFAVTIDNTAPTVNLQSDALAQVNAPFNLNIVFSEPVYTLNASAFAVENSEVLDIQNVNNTTFTATVKPNNEGPVNIKLLGNKVTDLAGNVNTESNTIDRVFDKTAPADYLISFREDTVNYSNQATVALIVKGTEVSSTYFYSISSNNGGNPLTGTATVLEEQFTITPIDVTSLSDGQLTVTFYLQDAAGNKGANVSAQVMKFTRNIVAITQPALVRVPIRTTFLQVPLPEKVEVTYTSGDKEQIPVTWLPGNYNAFKNGQYEISANLTLAPGTTNLNKRMVKIMIEVQPNKIPTALSISSDTFSPSITSTEAIGSFSTVDQDDSKFSYSLVSGAGDTHNNLFDLRYGQLFLKSNLGLSGQTQFTIRVRTTDTYNNSLEQSFTLKKGNYTKAADQLKVVNAFSPNGDGVNDEWTVPELKFYNKVNIEVFDRSGVKLFQTTNPEKGWNGQNLEGKVLPGAFLYIIQVEDIKLTKKGVITVLKK